MSKNTTPKNTPAAPLPPAAAQLERLRRMRTEMDADPNLEETNAAYGLLAEAYDDLFYNGPVQRITFTQSITVPAALGEKATLEAIVNAIRDSLGDAEIRELLTTTPGNPDDVEEGIWEQFEDVVRNN